MSLEVDNVEEADEGAALSAIPLPTSSPIRGRGRGRAPLPEEVVDLLQRRRRMLDIVSSVTNQNTLKINIGRRMASQTRSLNLI